MKAINKLDDGRVVVYEEGFWTGKKKISIDGEPLEKINKKTYRYQDTDYIIKGSYLFGASLEKYGESIVLARKLNALEYIFAILPLLMVIVGGAIGALCGIVGAVLFVSYTRSTESVIMKIVMGLACTALAVVAWFVIAVVLLSGLYA